MSATINGMDLQFADVLNADQVEEYDFLKINGGIYQIIKVTHSGDGFIFTYLDDYEEEDFIEVGYSDRFDLYYPHESEE
jgi:hypothetical protein